MKCKKWFYLLFIGLFFLACLFPLIGMLFTEEGPVRANQVLAPEPQLRTMDGALNKEYLNDLSDYFSDHFAYKQNLIDWNAAWLGTVLHTSNTDQVILGKEGWLFYEDSANDYLHIPTMSKRDAANAAIVLSLVQEYVESRGGVFTFTIAPNKNSLYPQYMAGNYEKTDNENNRLLVVEELLQNNVSYTDLYQLFDTSKEIMYHRYDSHWNNMGAGKVQNALMNSLGLSGTDYTGKSYETRKDFTGDLYEMLYPTSQEKCEEIYYEDPFTYTFTGSGADDTESIRYQAVCEGKEHSLVMYRDSFGNSLAPFMAEEFGNSFFSRAFPYNLDLVDENQADSVVIELVERHLPTLIQQAPVMAAPVRQVEVPDENQDAAGTVFYTGTASGNYELLQGTLTGALPDVGSRLYVVAEEGKNQTVYEAFPAGEPVAAPGDDTQDSQAETNQNTNFTLYLPAGFQGEISLVYTENGKQKRVGMED